MQRYQFNLFILFFLFSIWSCDEEGIVDAPLNEISDEEIRTMEIKKIQWHKAQIEY